MKNVVEILIGSEKHFLRDIKYIVAVEGLYDIIHFPNFMIIITQISVQGASRYIEYYEIIQTNKHFLPYLNSNDLYYSMLRVEMDTTENVINKS